VLTYFVAVVVEVVVVEVVDFRDGIVRYCDAVVIDEVLAVEVVVDVGDSWERFCCC